MKCVWQLVQLNCRDTDGTIMNCFTLDDMDDIVEKHINYLGCFTTIDLLEQFIMYHLETERGESFGNYYDKASLLNELTHITQRDLNAMHIGSLQVAPDAVLNDLYFKFIMGVVDKLQYENENSIYIGEDPLSYRTVFVFTKKGMSFYYKLDIDPDIDTYNSYKYFYSFDAPIFIAIPVMIVEGNEILAVELLDKNGGTSIIPLDIDPFDDGQDNLEKGFKNMKNIIPDSGVVLKQLKGNYRMIEGYDSDDNVVQVGRFIRRDKD